MTEQNLHLARSIERPRARRPLGGLRGTLVIVGTILSMGTGTASFAATPPAGSPLARGERPRIFFTSADLEGIRTRIATYYRSEFQAFIDLVTSPSALTASQRAVEANWGSFNNAFLAALDPAAMQARGFSFSASRDTRAEFCSAAMNYARLQLPDIIEGGGQNPEALHEGYPQPKFFPVLATYDWCHAQLSAADRQAIVDAYLTAYSRKYQGRNLLSFPIASLEMLANNRGANNTEDIMGILAFWGDSYPSASVQQELYDAFHVIWMDRMVTELQRFYGTGTGWHESPGGYFHMSFTDLTIIMGALESALGTRYTSSLPFFTNYPLFVLGNFKPHSLSPSGCPNGARCPSYQERWGTTSGGISGFSCKNSLINSGQLRIGRHPNAGLSKWLTNLGANEYDQCTTVVTRYGGAWTNAVLFWFLYGDRDIASVVPTLGRTLLHGLGEYTMKSGYGHQDSQVVFFGAPYRMYGHATSDIGHFSIHKFGDLILTPGNSKSGDANLEGAGRNLFKNVVAVRKGTDSILDFDGSVRDPLFESRGITLVRLAGQVTAEHLAQDVAYVRYDGSLSFAPSTASVWHRALARVYGPADHEYVVLLDRLNSPTATNTKIWKAWVPTQPQYVDGTVTQPRQGKWTSTNSTTLSITNQQSGLQTSNFVSAPTHGRLFLKVLSPSGAHVSLQGGPGKEFQSGLDDGSTPWGAPVMTDAMRAYLGWGRVEITPATPQPYDVFLTVMQFGDSQSLATPAPAVRINSSEGRTLGAHIRDQLAQWVMMFAQDANQVGQIQATSYSFTAVTPISHHLVTDLVPNRELYVDVRTSGGVTTVSLSPTSVPGAPGITTSSGGVLRFSIDGGRVLGPPVAPQNIRIQIR